MMQTYANYDPSLQIQRFEFRIVSHSFASGSAEVGTKTDLASQRQVASDRAQSVEAQDGHTITQYKSYKNCIKYYKVV